MSPTRKPARMGTSVNPAGVLRAASSFRPGGLRSTGDRAGQRCVPSARRRSGATPPPLPGFSFSNKASRRLLDTESRSPDGPLMRNPCIGKGGPLPAAANWAIATPAVAHGVVGDSGRGLLLSRLSSHDMGVAAARRCGYFRTQAVTKPRSPRCASQHECRSRSMSAEAPAPRHKQVRPEGVVSLATARAAGPLDAPRRRSRSRRLRVAAD